MPQSLNHLSELAVAQARRVLEKIPLLGAVTWLMLQQSGLRHTLVSELDWRVMPPLVLEQSKIYLRDGAPVGYVAWARLSDAVVERYRQAPHQLMPGDWKSGEQAWLIDLVAPFGGSQDIVRDLLGSVFAGQSLFQLMPDGVGGVVVHDWSASSPTPPSPPPMSE
jgi:cytolysin-activating lysine-acyltransferase